LYSTVDSKSKSAFILYTLLLLLLLELLFGELFKLIIGGGVRYCCRLLDDEIEVDDKLLDEQQDEDELKLFKQCESNDKALSNLNLLLLPLLAVDVVVVVSKSLCRQVSLLLVGVVVSFIVLVTIIGTSNVFDLQII